VNEPHASDLTGTQAKITLTLDCSNDCRFCYNRYNRSRGGDATIPRERAFELVEEAARAGADTLNLIGGEVTILPYFLELVEFGRKRFGSVSINTNGRRFSEPAFAEAAVKAGLTHVDVSLHGSSAAVHEVLTQAPGSYDECVAGLRELVALAGAGDRVRVAVTTLVVPENLTDLVALADLLASLGVSSWRVKYAHGVLGCAPEDSDAPIPSYTEAGPILRQVLSRHPGRLNTRLHDVPLCLLGDLMLRSTDSDDHRVALYKEQGLLETVRVAGHWGETSPRCAPCAARTSCCKPSPAYVAQHGDAELVPFDETGLAAAVARAREAEARLRHDAQAAVVAPARPERPQAEVLDGLERAAAAGAWAAVRGLAGQVAADHPEHAAVERLRRRAERALLSQKAERLVAAGRPDEARLLATLIARRYHDLDRAPASPASGDRPPSDRARDD
jgi:uncharacterized Fe-S cluster-containing radical SAM superfamily protein